MSKKGVTLLEMLFATSILTLVMGTLFLLTRSLADTVAVQEAKVICQDEARGAMFQIVRELRQAANFSIQTGVGGGQSFVIYNIAEDVDGNGTAVDVEGNVETGPIRVIMLDTADYNNDDLTLTQLLLCYIGPDGFYKAEELSNNIAPFEDTDGDDVFEPGVSFSRWDSNSMLVTIRTQRQAGPTGPILNTVMNEIVLPRN